MHASLAGSVAAARVVGFSAGYHKTSHFMSLLLWLGLVCGQAGGRRGSGFHRGRG